MKYLCFICGSELRLGTNESDGLGGPYIKDYYAFCPCCKLNIEARNRHDLSAILRRLN